MKRQLGYLVEIEGNQTLQERFIEEQIIYDAQQMMAG